MSLNKCLIIGNLGRDPEMRYTPSGQAVTQFTVAVNRNYKDAQGERQEETEWFRVVAWAQQAEFAAEYLRKGNRYSSRAVCRPAMGGSGRPEALHHRARCQHYPEPRAQAA